MKVGTYIHLVLENAIKKIKKKNCFGISMTKLTQKWVVEV